MSFLPSRRLTPDDVVNTAFMMGGALGLAVLASTADSRTSSLLDSGRDELAAINGGYHAAFLLGALFVVASAVVGAVLLRAPAPAMAEHREPATETA
jgi:hypothetical protein